MKKLLVLLLIIAGSTPISGCSNACNAVKQDADTVNTQIDAALNRAIEEYNAAEVAEGYEGTKWKSIPAGVDGEGKPLFRLAYEPILDEFYSYKKVWLTIKVNNPDCFTAREVADAEIELQSK